MPSIINLSSRWEHTLTEILNHANKTEVGIIMRAWVKDHKLEDMSNLLIHDLNDFTPGGTLCHYKESSEAEETKMMPTISRSLYITAKSHECEEVLDPEYTPSNSGKGLFDAKQVFMFSVLDKHLLTDMGKTKRDPMRCYIWARISTH